MLPGAPDEAPLYRFGRAELDAAAQELTIDGKRAPLGARGVGLLRMLIERRQAAVSKHELLEKVWSGVIVEENNLQVQISTLRRLLGPHAIATIPGRGYRFMLPLEGEPPDPSEANGTLRGPANGEPMRRAANAGNLPVRLPELYGRHDESAAVQALVQEHSLVSIAGAAGIGKTRLAMAVAAAMARECPDGAWLIELAAVNDPRLLVQSVAQGMRLALPGLREPIDELCAALHARRALLVLDNCEHLIEDISTLIARLLNDGEALRILATTQEALKLPEECVYRLSPLSVPANAQVADPLSYGAVRLLFERVRALRPQFNIDSSNVEAVVDICRRLDGLPLAIELAAARVPMLGVMGVEERLGERFHVLTGGSRVAPKRHQTLRAALDWSHALLDENERAVYRRLGAFVGSFSLEGAQELVASEDIDAWSALEYLSSLVEKSLVIAEGEPRPRYRMLESTREHALEQLAGAGETYTWLARHAEVTWHALQHYVKGRRTEAILAEMPNVRSAYEWARTTPQARVEAVALATLPSMIVAVRGAVQEARERLLEVEPLVGDDLPKPLVAQYWQWYARIGLGGRLPASRCVDALQRAERMFSELGRERHVHACRRHLAEALLDAGDLAGSAQALERARMMEIEGWPPVDTMRRMRVQGLWLAKAGRTEEALHCSALALEKAQDTNIGRYQLVLLDDIARFHLEAGNAHEAAERYSALVDRSRHAQAGLTLSNALSGLIAALTAEKQLDEAEAVAAEAVPVLSRSSILVARADILSLLMAQRGRHEAAARLLGASEHFRASCETPRDPVERRCRADAMAFLAGAVGQTQLREWMTAGAGATEAELVALLPSNAKASPR
ncbi:winged helix-turn-helix domain-containing protein [Variovorax sp. OV329]|uniref:ATP-binding protein n=1 Tax=Variovorax sp. OV329 TaxID=1882825 RepID=UPI0008F3A89E|nr:winged helix-turn-helix domain-containing protein [Variovorax sp. OV329]SFM05114.1 Predicted ATPase [Variovorax sp. OV329]